MKPAQSPQIKALKKPTLLNQSIKAAIIATVVVTAVLPLTTLMAAEATVSQQQYQIPAGPMAQSLNQFASQSGITLSFDPSEVAGINSNGIQGQYSVEEALQGLVANTGLKLGHTGSGGYLVEASKSVEGEITLPMVTVSSRALGALTEDTGSYTVRETTLMKGSHTLKEIPQSVSVMTRKQMDDLNLVDLKDALNQTTGIVGLQGVGEGLIVSSRGFQIDDWQYDGVPISRNTYSLGNWATQDLIFYDRLEIMRGASGLLQGTGSPGGAVNLVRKRGQSVPTMALTGKAGSWDHYGLQLDAGGPLNSAGNIRGRIVVDEDQSNSFIDYGWSKTRSLYGALDIDLSEDTTLGFAVSQSNGESRDNIRGLPRYADGSMPDVSRSIYTGARWNRSEIDVTTLYADLEHRFNDDWAFKVGAVHMTEDNQAKNQRTQSIGGLLPDGSRVQYADFVTDFQSTKVGLDMNLTGKFQALSMEQEVMLGGNYSRLETDDRYARTFNDSSDTIFDLDNDRPDISYDNLLNSPGGQGTLSKYDIRQKGLYGTWRVKPVDDLTLVLGSRVSWYDYSYKSKTETAANGITANTPSTGNEAGEVTPYAGIIYDLSHEWAVYASYTDVFQPQTNRDISGKVLKPIIGTNYEIGLKGELLDSRVNTSLAIFRYDQENRAINDIAGGMECDGWYCSIAAGKVRSQGVDAEISGEVTENLQLFAGYTYNTTKYLEDLTSEGSVYSTWTPKHMLRVWGNYQLNGDWSRVSTGLGFITQTHTLGYEGNYDIPGYTVWNARIGYQLTPEIGLALNANNLFDKTYITSAYNQLNGNNNFGAPRNVMFMVKYTPQF